MTDYPKYLEILNCDLSLSTDSEISYAYEVIHRLRTLTGGVVYTLVAAYKDGPLFDGDVPSKAARDTLVKEGYMVRIVVKGEQGYNALTYKGRDLYNLIQADITKEASVTKAE